MFLLQNKVCNVVIHFAAGSKAEKDRKTLATRNDPSKCLHLKHTLYLFKRKPKLYEKWLQ